MSEKTLGERLRTARKQLNLTLEAFGEPLDVSKGAVSRWENGGEVTKTVCLAIEAAYKISSIWLATGNGSLFIQPTGRGNRLETTNWQEFPLIPGAPTCGPGGEIEDPGPESPRFPLGIAMVDQVIRDCGAGRPETLFFTRCKGESMRPTIHDGDIALVNTAEQLRLAPVKDGIYLVRQELGSNDAMVKRVWLAEEEVLFHSDALGFRSIRVPIDGVPIQDLVLGRVCWVARNVLADEAPGRW